MNEKKVRKVNNLFFGRQRRIDLIEKIVYVLVAIFAISLVLYLVSHKTNFVDNNVDYAYLVSYMQKKGYNCKALSISGGSCTLRNNDIENTFLRYDEGFQYNKSTANFSLIIRHLEGSDKIEFKTNSNAYLGYRNNQYYCTTKNGIFSEVDECKTDSGELLDFESYVGFINEALYELDGLVNASGYNKTVLLENYKWEKK